MKKILFIADYFKSELNGGGESNDNNLISHLSKNNDVIKTKANSISLSKIDEADFIIVGNFVTMAEGVKRYLASKKNYIIYEHDHKYVKTRDPSKFANFDIPIEQIINEEFYNSAKCVVVLSEICKKVIESNLKHTKVHNIGCSLWSEETISFLKENANKEKNKDVCILLSNNPTKNYIETVKYCRTNNLDFEPIESQNHIEFLKKMSHYKSFLFIPTVLETFSRVCAEAKMLNLNVMTNKKKIGFFSEDYSSLSGLDLIKEIEEKNQKALEFFESLI